MCNMMMSLIYVIAQKGQLLPPLIGKTTNFKMVYLMTYICYPFFFFFKFGDVTIDIYPYKSCKIQVARGNFCYYEIHPDQFNDV